MSGSFDKYGLAAVVLLLAYIFFFGSTAQSPPVAGGGVTSTTSVPASVPSSTTSTTLAAATTTTAPCAYECCTDGDCSIYDGTYYYVCNSNVCVSKTCSGDAECRLGYHCENAGDPPWYCIYGT